MYLCWALPHAAQAVLCMCSEIICYIANFAAATCHHFAVDNAQAGYSHIEPHRHLLSLRTDCTSITALTTRRCLTLHFTAAHGCRVCCATCQHQPCSTLRVVLEGAAVCCLGPALCSRNFRTNSKQQIIKVNLLGRASQGTQGYSSTQAHDVKRHISHTLKSPQSLLLTE
jgi:hypothetical protein